MAQTFKATSLGRNALYRQNRPTPEKLNCAELVLEASDIAALETLIRQKALPNSEGGFFFGHQFQDEAANDNAEQDLAFCAWAKDALTNGQTVVYSCWW